MAAGASPAAASSALSSTSVPCSTDTAIVAVVAWVEAPHRRRAVARLYARAVRGAIERCPGLRVDDAAVGKALGAQLHVAAQRCCQATHSTTETVFSKNDSKGGQRLQRADFTCTLPDLLATPEWCRAVPKRPSGFRLAKVNPGLNLRMIHRRGR